MPSKKTKKAPKRTRKLLLSKDFNLLQTFYRAAPGQDFEWVQVIAGRPVQTWTREEFRVELFLTALDL